MKLISMRVSNLGPFFGEQKIEFSPKYDSPINVVVGPNGSGKTTLVTAIGWALYGDEYLSRYHQLVVNSHATRRGIHNGSVELTFEHVGRLYLLTRLLQKSEQLELRSAEAILTVFDATERSVPLIVPNAQEFVNSIFPIGLGRFILGDGELLYEVMHTNDGDLSLIGRAVRELFSSNLVTNAGTNCEPDIEHNPTEMGILKAIEIAVNDRLRTLNGRIGKHSISFDTLGHLSVNEHDATGGEMSLIAMIVYCLSLAIIGEQLIQHNHTPRRGVDTFPIILEYPFGPLDAWARHEALNFLLTLDRPLILILPPRDIEWLTQYSGFCKKIGGFHALVMHDPQHRNFQQIEFDFRGVRVPLSVTGSAFEGTEITTII